ncbi:MAG: MBL fold metallo-hydrolase [Candidatus Marinimicrobia bacterium]|nr:MBL fold metallo-hydrolase [Candidatus Neomarinimicrobiota bacterium]
MSLHVHRLVVGPFQENTFIVHHDEDKTAIIFDPGDESEKIIDSLARRGLTLLAVFNTHAHIDHIGAVAELQTRLNVPFYLHIKEHDVLNQLENHSAMFGLPSIKTPKVDHWINKESEIIIGAYCLKIIHTPGHTPGGVCYLLNGHGFVGDTLFRGSVGRTDLPGGSWSTLETSLKEMIHEIPHDTMLHTGHGPQTTLSEERKHNPFLRPLIS